MSQFLVFPCLTLAFLASLEQPAPVLADALTPALSHEGWEEGAGNRQVRSSGRL
jgi:hypothetical protein